MATKGSHGVEWTGLSFWDKLCMLEVADWDFTAAQAHWSPEDHEWVPNARHRALHTVGFGVHFELITTMPCFFPFGIRKYVIYFGFYRSPQLRDSEYLNVFIVSMCKICIYGHIYSTVCVCVGPQTTYTVHFLLLPLHGLQGLNPGHQTGVPYSLLSEPLYWLWLRVF